MISSLLLLIALSPACGPCQPNTIKSSVVEPAVVVKRGERSIGSGTQIRHRGQVYILTAAHVVDEWVKSPKGDKTQINLAPVMIVTRKGGTETTRKCLIVAFDEARDLALLKPLDTKGMTPVPVSQAVTLDLGEDAWFCGNGIMDWNLSKTWVSKEQPNEVLIGSGSGWFGHSGSGLFVKRDRFELVGVIVAGITTGQFRLLVAVDLPTIREFLSNYDDVAK